MFERQMTSFSKMQSWLHSQDPAPRTPRNHTSVSSLRPLMPLAHLRRRGDDDVRAFIVPAIRDHRQLSGPIRGTAAPRNATQIDLIS